MFNNNQGQGTSPKTDLDFWVSAFTLDRQSRGFSPGTLAYYKVKFKRFSIFTEEHKITRVQDITANDLRTFLIELEEEGHNKGGVIAIWRAIKAFLRFYEEELDLDDWKNPVYKVRPKPPNNEPLDPVEIDVVRKLLATCEKTLVGRRDASILTFLMDTGVRASELVSLDRDDVNLVTGAVFVRHGKGDKGRNVFLAKTARRYLRRYLNARGEDASKALFVTDKEDQGRDRLTYFGLRSMIRRRSGLANLEKPPSLHSFRRSFVINSIRNGADLLTLQHLLGHSTLKVIERYAKILEDDLMRVHSKTSPVDKML